MLPALTQMSLARITTFRARLSTRGGSIDLDARRGRGKDDAAFAVVIFSFLVLLALSLLVFGPGLLF
jgi:hypothetical protein